MITLFQLIEEAVHKNDPFLNKLLPRNQQNRQLFAEKLRYLRKARDKNRENSKVLKANLIDNLSRNLTRTPSSDPVMKNLISTSLSKLKNRSNLLAYMPQKVTIPWENFNDLKEKYKQDLNNGRTYPNKITNYFNLDDINKQQKNFKLMNDRARVNDTVFDMMKYMPRMSPVIREPNPLINYNQSNRLTKYYNLKDNDFAAQQPK